MKISMIAAMSKNRVIGKAGKLPWHLPEDLKYFKDKTRGHPVVMGRKTFDSLGCKPLPGRKNMVVTRQPAFSAPGVDAFGSLEAALKALELEYGATEEEIFIIGGGELYTAGLQFADLIYLTEIDCEVEGGDAFFPHFALDQFKEITRRVVDEPMPHAYVVYKRMSA